jgi:hypothetical protein
VTHYEVLGVEPGADSSTVRAAYLDCARRAHPDRQHADRDDALPAVVDAEERMRQVNAAWAVLGDPEARSRYDRSLALPGTGGSGSTGPVLTTPSRRFTPVPDDGDDDAEVDAWRNADDEYDPRTGVGRVLGAGPPLMFVLGVVLLVVGSVVGLRSVVALAVACFLVALLAFIGVPLVALARSKAHDRG